MEKINGYKPLSSSFKEAWEYLLTFKENWDGNGAKPLNEDVYENALEVIGADEKDHLLDDWEVSLNINGSLYFTYEDKNTTSMINLGKRDFSYFIKYKGKVVNKSDGDYYSCNNFIKIIKRVSNHTRLMGIIEKYAKSGERAFYYFKGNKELQASCIFFKKKDKIFMKNQILFGYHSRNHRSFEWIPDIGFGLYKNIIKVDYDYMDVFDDLVDAVFLEGKSRKSFIRKIKDFRLKLEGILETAHNPYKLDLTPPSEKTFVKVFNPDGTLLVETDNDNLVSSIRCQIKEKKLSGFYLTFTAEDKTEARIEIGPDGLFQKSTNQAEFVDYPLVVAESLSEKLLF